MPVAKRENCHLYYEIKGHGIPLTLINGFTYHLGMWDPYVSTLEHQFQILRFDQRGSGRSDTPLTPYSIDQMADDLIFLLDTLALDHANMVGFSMGNMVIQSIALRYPDRLSKAVMISPFNRFPTSAYMQAINTAKLRAIGVDSKLLIEKILPWVYSSTFLKDPSKVKQTIEDLENNPYPQSSAGYDRQLEALYAYDETDKLNQIAHPILLIAGEEDLNTPFYGAQILKDLLQNATLKILPNVGHMGHIEQKQEILNLVMTWFLQK